MGRVTASAVHHLNCATFHPLGIGGVAPSRMVAHCLLVEGADGLTLVDTGFGASDHRHRWQRMGPPFVLAFRPACDTAETAVERVRALGYDPEDVRDVVVTHLDLDHAGGLADFPLATVHVFADELDAAMKRRHPKEKGRYVKAQWAHGPQWLPHRLDGDKWLGFEGVQVLGDDVLLVPLVGHTRGHCAVAVRRPSGGWFLHAGDSYFSAGEKEQPPTCPSGLKAFQAAVQMDKEARLANAGRLRELHVTNGPGSGAAPGETVTIFCAHDADEYDALAAVTD